MLCASHPPSLCVCGGVAGHSLIYRPLLQPKLVVYEVEESTKNRLGFCKAGGCWGGGHALACKKGRECLALPRTVPLGSDNLVRWLN